MGNEQREQEIRERLARLGNKPWEIGPYPGSPVDDESLLIYESAHPGPFREIAVAYQEAAAALFYLRSDMTYLLDEVAYLRGQLSDLCEDSRAVQEVMKARAQTSDVSKKMRQLWKRVDSVGIDIRVLARHPDTPVALIPILELIISQIENALEIPLVSE